MKEFGHSAFARWERGLSKKGFTAVEDRGGMDIRKIRLDGDSIEQVAQYVSKASYEAVSSATKHGRNGNRAPMQILRDAVETGNADDIDTFWEFEQASQGRKKLTWSNGLREWARLSRERSDEEIVADDRHGESVLIMPKATWAVVCYEADDLLSIYEQEGLPGAERWLRSRNLDYVIPEGSSVVGQPL
ncbi:hypothetical protein GCM10009608_62000 [Pseudonocardia alaniniphila]